MIDFAIRNGVSFSSVASLLIRDLSELLTYTWSMAKAQQDCFNPKVTGWAEKNVAMIGDPDEE